MPFAIVLDAPANDKVTALLWRTLRWFDVEVGSVPVLSIVACRTSGATRSEQRACRGNLMAQLRAAGCGHVMLMGRGAVGAWRTDVAVEQMRGGVYCWAPGGRVAEWMIGVTFGPGKVLADYTKRALGEWREDWGKLIENWREGIGIEGLGDRCRWKGREGMCGEWVDRYDVDGIAWCKRHWEEGRRGNGRTRKIWSKGDQLRLGGMGGTGEP